MSGAYTIRAATVADRRAVEAMLRAANLPLDGLQDQFGDRYAVAESGGAIIGVEGVEIHGADGLLRSAAVDQAWRGRGVGDALTRDRIAWAGRQDLRALYLLTTTARAYFPRFGFKPVDRNVAPDAIRQSREFAEACPASAAFMQLTLENH